MSRVTSSMYFSRSFFRREIFSVRLFEVVRPEVLEREIFELGLDPADAQAIRQRRVDVEGLLRDALLLVFAHELERAHVVRAVGELHEDDANVLRHRDDHLPEVLGLLLFLAERVRGRELRELRDAVDDVEDLFAEKIFHFVRSRERVFDRVVQQTRNDRRLIELELSEQTRDLERVNEIGLA